jgi:hypothetical protein
VVLRARAEDAAHRDAGRLEADEVVLAWHGDPACVAAGQRALANRVACNVAALQGSYTSMLEPSYVLA